MKKRKKKQKQNRNSNAQAEARIRLQRYQDEIDEELARLPAPFVGRMDGTPAPIPEHQPRCRVPEWAYYVQIEIWKHTTYLRVVFELPIYGWRFAGDCKNIHLNSLYPHTAEWIMPSDPLTDHDIIVRRWDELMARAKSDVDHLREKVEKLREWYKCKRMAEEIDQNSKKEVRSEKSDGGDGDAGGAHDSERGLHDMAGSEPDGG